MLSYNINYENSVFLPMFTNQCKGFDSNDSSLEQMEVSSKLICIFVLLISNLEVSRDDSWGSSPPQ